MHNDKSHFSIFENLRIIFCQARQLINIFLFMNYGNLHQVHRINLQVPIQKYAFSCDNKYND